MATLVGLSFAHLLRGLMRFIEHPGRERLYWLHLAWSLWMFIYLIHFWWWQFRLEIIVDWTVPKYLFIILYSLILYALTTLLFPEDLKDYSGYREYFLSRRKWFFGILTAMFVVDIGDTLLKGFAYTASLGWHYSVGIAGYLVLSIIALLSPSERFLAAFVILGIIYQVAYMMLAFYRLS